MLIVGGDPELRSALSQRLADRCHRCTHVSRLDEGRAAVVRTQYDVIAINPTLPDGDGMDLAQQVVSCSPWTKTIVFSDTDSFEHAHRAIRCGAVDFIRLPLAMDEFVERIELAITNSVSERQREQRLRRVQRIAEELNIARDEISDQVDTLCNDLVLAYQELTDQMQDVAVASEFRTLLRMELDIEDALRTTLEYMLGKTGPTNAAVFLPDVDGRYSLGAYVNYDCPRESIDSLLNHLCEAICPQMSVEEDLVVFHDAKEFSQWIGMEGDFLGDAQIVGFSCLHEGECQAVVVLFRNRSNPFDEALAGTLDLLRTIFAEQLGEIIRVHHRAAPEWPTDSHGDDEWEDDFGYGYAA